MSFQRGLSAALNKAESTRSFGYAQDDYSGVILSDRRESKDLLEFERSKFFNEVYRGCSRRLL